MLISNNKNKNFKFFFILVDAYGPKWSNFSLTDKNVFRQTREPNFTNLKDIFTIEVI